MQLDNRSDVVARHGARPPQRKLLGPQTSIPSVLVCRHFRSRLPLRTKQEHPLPTHDSSEKDSAWLLATLRNSLIQEGKRTVSPYCEVNYLIPHDVNSSEVMDEHQLADLRVR